MNATGLGFWNFLTAGTRINPNVSAAGYSAGSGTSHIDAITLQEIIAGINKPFTSGEGGYGASGASANPFGTIGNNLMTNLLPMVFSLAGVKVVDKILTTVGFSRSVNKIFRQIGVSKMVRA